MQTSSTSQVSVSFFPPAAASTLKHIKMQQELQKSRRRRAGPGLRCFSTHATSILPSGLLVAPRTFVLSLNFKPCFCRMRWKFLDISISMPIPPTWPRNSTAVTLEPSRCQTDPCKRSKEKLLLTKQQFSRCEKTNTDKKVEQLCGLLQITLSLRITEMETQM